MSSFSSHASSSYLLPSPSSSSSVDSCSIPKSTRPIPAPPLSFRPYTTALSTDLTTPTTETASFSSLPAIVRDVSKASISISDLEASSVGGSTGPRLKQEEVDAQRLRQLGYDSVLGRDYTFWSSLSISWLNIGCLQVCSSVPSVPCWKTNDGETAQGTIYAVSGAYSYGGPAMIVRLCQR